MSYAVKEVFATLQGEGFHAGRVAVFCRFAGCNLWSGREEDRAAAVCTFCDTDFLGGRRFSAKELAEAISREWPGGGDPFVVFTGGEPLLQLNAELIEAVKRAGFYVAVETNGTRPAPDGIDWLCVSPKAGACLRQRSGDELKLVWPQPIDPRGYELLDFGLLSVQPMDGTDLVGNAMECVRFCLENPRWRLSWQTHKSLGIR